MSIGLPQPASTADWRIQPATRCEQSPIRYLQAFAAPGGCLSRRQHSRRLAGKAVAIREEALGGVILGRHADNDLLVGVAPQPCFQNAQRPTAQSPGGGGKDKQDKPRRVSSGCGSSKRRSITPASSPAEKHSQQAKWPHHRPRPQIGPGLLIRSSLARRLGEKLGDAS